MPNKHFKTYLVGGAIRDELLQRPVKEQDWVVVGANPQRMLDAGFKPVGKDFPVFLHPQTHDEYALARTERKSAKGYHGFNFQADETVTLEQDLLRRDLTINAMAKDQQGQIIDPFGGQKDLNQRLLRHVSPAFAEDPVRILRVARFMARYRHLGFRIAPETLVLMRNMVDAGEVHALVAERVWQECHKALTEKSPHSFIESLRACGALKILFPEIEALFGVPAPAKYHPEIDTGVHTLMVLQQACILTEDPQVRFAALVHDLGKALTPMAMWPRHHGHEQAGTDPIKALGKRLRVPKAYLHLALLVCQYHGMVHKIRELKPTTLVKLLAKLDAFRKPERLKQFALACTADARGRPGFEKVTYPQADILLNAFNAAKTVDVQALLAQGFKGEKLVQAIHKARASAVSKIIT